MKNHFFQTEKAALSMLNDTNIVTCYGYGESGDRYFIVLELLGTTVADIGTL